MFFAYARGRGLKTGSLDVAVSAIPKYDGYHFREDRTHRSAFANVLAQRARCVQAEATLSSLSEENLRFLQEAYPYDRYDLEREFEAVGFVAVVNKELSERAWV